MWSAASVLACALSVLGRSEHRFHPINLVETAPPGVSANAEGYVTRNPDTINVLTSSSAFQEARRANRHCGARRALAKVASVLVHEEWHLHRGPDERGAYEAQLTALAMLGFDENSKLYWGVKQSMLRVVNTLRARRTPDVVLVTAETKSSLP